MKSKVMQIESKRSYTAFVDAKGDEHYEFDDYEVCSEPNADSTADISIIKQSNGIMNVFGRITFGNISTNTILTLAFPFKFSRTHSFSVTSLIDFKHNDSEQVVELRDSSEAYIKINVKDKAKYYSNYINFFATGYWKDVEPMPQLPQPELISPYAYTSIGAYMFIASDDMDVNSDAIQTYGSAHIGDGYKMQFNMAAQLIPDRATRVSEYKRVHPKLVEMLNEQFIDFREPEVYYISKEDKNPYYAYMKPIFKVGAFSGLPKPTFLHINDPEPINFYLAYGTRVREIIIKTDTAISLYNFTSKDMSFGVKGYTLELFSISGTQDVASIPVGETDILTLNADKKGMLLQGLEYYIEYDYDLITDRFTYDESTSVGVTFFDITANTNLYGTKGFRINNGASKIVISLKKKV